MRSPLRWAAISITVCLILLSLTPGALAVTKTWNGGTSSDWFTDANWDGGKPQTGEDAVIADVGNNVVLTGVTPNLNSLTISNKMLIFTNYATILNAATVNICSGGVFTMTGSFTTNGMTNRIYVVCTDLTLEYNGQINADAHGFYTMNGPGRGGIDTGNSSTWNYWDGGGYGGKGGRGDDADCWGGNTYGSASAPELPGSGGGAHPGHIPYAGPGGGAVRINATGTVTIRGTISAKGGNSTDPYSAGGSGGAIYITCDTFGGDATGLLRADGGAGDANNGAGGGGRIAVNYANVGASHAARFSAAPGSASWAYMSATNRYVYMPMAGTLWLPDTQLLSETLDNTLFAGAVNIQGIAAWSPASLTVANCSVSFGQTNALIQVGGDIVVGSGGALGIGIFSEATNCALNCGGNLILTNGGSLYAYAGKTNGATGAYGALVSVTNNLIVGSGSWVYPVCHWTNGAAPLIRAGNLIVGTNGGINASAKGLRALSGPGQSGTWTSNFGAGASHAGRGGYYVEVNNRDGASKYGITYGALSKPLLPGSGGSAHYNHIQRAGAGGGVVWIETTNAITLRGTVAANGGSAFYQHSGAGSGGSVYLKCVTFGGTADGVVSVDGGNSYNGLSGAGGAGSIAVDYQNADPSHQVCFAARRGTNEWADLSDDRWYFASQSGTLWLPDTQLLAETISSNQFVECSIYGIISWSPNSLTVSNASFSFAENQCQITVANDIRVDAGGQLGMGRYATGTNFFLRCGGNLILTNGGALVLYGGLTNSGLTNYSALVAVTNDILIGPSSWIYPYSHPLNGGSPRITAGGDATLETGGGVWANNRGFKMNAGPGTGEYNLGVPYAQGGGGYGGKGGDGGTGHGGTPYGSPVMPIDPGSGGGTYSADQIFGTLGGGAARLEAGGILTINGAVTAKGGNDVTDYVGGGSGGGIYLKCNTLAGSGGLVTAAGGNALNPQTAPNRTSGGGGGGRIALDYQSLGAAHDIKFSAAPATYSWAYGGIMGAPSPVAAFWRRQPRMGTLALPDYGLLSDTLTSNALDRVALCFSQTNAWSVGSLTITNGTVGFRQSSFLLTVSNNLTVGTNAELDFGDMTCTDMTLACEGNLLLTNGGSLIVFAGVTNAVANANARGVTVAVSNDFVLASGSWVYPDSQPDNGGAPLFLAGNMIVQANAGFDANYKGFWNCKGPGAGSNPYGSGGGGYGGKGGDGVGYGGVGGAPYGRTNGPYQAGSSGGGYPDAPRIFNAGHGGGMVRIDATNAILLSGTLTANGATGFNDQWTAGGSGGAIYLTCHSFTGSTSAVLRASGGGIYSGAQCGGGGGGRIAIWLDVPAVTREAALAGDPTAISNIVDLAILPNYDGELSVTGGVGATTGDPGTKKYFKPYAGPSYYLQIAGKPNNTYGSPQPLGYGTHLDIPAGTWVTNYVTTPADEAAGTRHAGIGWDVRTEGGDPVASDTGTNAVFQMTTNMILDWNWTNQYLLTATYEPATNGSVNYGAVNGWYTDNVAVAGILATASNGFLFSQWTGDVPPINATDNPLTLTMTQPRTIQPVFIAAVSVTKVWNGNGVWESATNWDPEGVPTTLDTAIIGSGTSILSQQTYARNLIVSNGATLMFTNWTTKFYVVSNVVVQNNGVITLPPAFSNNVMSNRIYLACVNLTVNQGGRIDADGKGYYPWCGPGRGTNGYYGTGGSYGGLGGREDPVNGGANLPLGPTYGAINAPEQPGSGGGSYSANNLWQPLAGAGGGAIRLDVSGTMTVEGTITANGGDSGGFVSAGGSGGGIYIVCNTFGGSSNGLIRVNGGNGYTSVPQSGGGGGGRIALVYQNVAPTHAVRFSASPAAIEWAAADLTNRWPSAAQRGTLWLSNTNLLSEAMSGWQFKDVSLVVSGLTAWTVNNLTLNDNAFAFTANGFRLNVLNDLVVGSGANLGVGAYYNSGTGFEVNVGGNLVLTNGGRLDLYSGTTNGVGTNYGARLAVAGDILIGPSSWLAPRSFGADGSSPLLTMNNLTIAAGGGIDAMGKGYASNTGPGVGPVQSGNYAGGSGYGGKGGGGGDPTTSSQGGVPYGSLNAPLDAGTGGGCHSSHITMGGGGGGLVSIQAVGKVTIDGTIDAAGGNSVEPYGMPGSGGAIYLRCNTFGGAASGLLSVRGGTTITTNGAPGGGGRIALDYQNLAASHSARFSAAPGAGGYFTTDPDNLWPYRPQPGTIWLPNQALLTGNLTSQLFDGGRLYFATSNSWSVDSLTISNCSLTFAQSAFQLTVSNNLTIANGYLGLGDDPSGTNYALTCGGGLAIRNGGSLYVFAGLTNSAITNYGTLVNVGGISLDDNCWIYPVAQDVNGATVLFRAGDITIGTNAGFNASGKGFASRNGPGIAGVTYYVGGSGYGGSGGQSATYPGGYTNASGGPTYGSTNMPILLGSGGFTYNGAGWYQRGGPGGGAVRIESTGTLNLCGTITANGGRGLGDNVGGGSGGSISIQCGDFKAAVNSALRANGGNASIYSGGGGGGRIAMWQAVSATDRALILAGNQPQNVIVATNFSAKLPALSATANPGVGYDLSTNPAQAGTIIYFKGLLNGTIMTLW